MPTEGASLRAAQRFGRRGTHVNSTLFKPLAFPEYGLPEIIRGKYKLRILWDLQQGARRFGEIRKRLNLGVTDPKEVAPRVLSRELRSLAELGLVHRRAYEAIPPRVEYRLTPLGRSLLPVISKILEWGTRHPSCGLMPRRALAVRSSLISAPQSLDSRMKSQASYTH